MGHAFIFKTLKHFGFGRVDECGLNFIAFCYEWCPKVKMAQFLCYAQKLVLVNYS